MLSLGRLQTVSIAGSSDRNRCRLRLMDKEVPILCMVNTLIEDKACMGEWMYLWISNLNNKHIKAKRTRREMNKLGIL